MAAILSAVALGTSLGPFELDWLMQGLLASLREGRPLDDCLGLCGRGRGRLRERTLLRQRDELLCLALEAVASSDDVTDWERCTRLAPLAKRFMDREWRRVRVLPEPAADWPAWKRFVFLAAQIDPDLACSAWTLDRAIARKRGVSCNGKGGSIALTRFL